VVRGVTIGTGAKINPASLLTAQVTLSVGGIKISSGYATNNPEHSPLGSITALANELCVERGMTIAAGHTVICGHCCQAAFAGAPAPNMAANSTPNPEWGAAAWNPGDVLRADFEGLGVVEATLG
jgi:2-keto-4-pentenoate hydratase